MCWGWHEFLSFYSLILLCEENTREAATSQLEDVSIFLYVILNSSLFWLFSLPLIACAMSLLAFLFFLKSGCEMTLQCLYILERLLSKWWDQLSFKSFFLFFQMLNSQLFPLPIFYRNNFLSEIPASYHRVVRFLLTSQQFIYNLVSCMVN